VTDLLQRVQARFLKELFLSSKGGFVLKGGMALSILFGATRRRGSDVEDVRGDVGRDEDAGAIDAPRPPRRRGLQAA
jgi:hypothetical protein